MKENGFTLAKARSRRYIVQTITDVDDADDSAFGRYTCPGRIPAAWSETGSNWHRVHVNKLRIYIDIVAGVLQGDTLAPYLFIFSLDFVLRASVDLIKENGFTLAKARSRRYTVQTITDADDADDNASGRYTCPGQIPAAQSETGSKWHRAPCQLKENRVRVL